MMQPLTPSVSRNSGQFCHCLLELAQTPEVKTLLPGDVPAGAANRSGGAQASHPSAGPTITVLFSQLSFQVQKFA